MQQYPDPAALPSYYSGNAADVGTEEFRALLGADEFDAAIEKGEKPPVNTYPLPDPGYKFYKKNMVEMGRSLKYSWSSTLKESGERRYGV